MFQRLSYRYLKRAVARAGVAKQVEAAQVLEITQRVLVQFLPQNDVQHIRPAYVKNRTLALEIAHPALGYRLQQHEKAIIGAVNTQLGRPEILRLQFLLPGLSPQNYSPPLR